MTDSTPTRPPVAIQILSRPDCLHTARDVVSGMASRVGFDQRAAAHVAMAVDEALSNIICHGYERREDGVIWLKFWPIEKSDDEPAGLRIVIEDEARQTDPSSIQGRDLDEERPGGLGVHMIRKLMDSATYEKREFKGMRLTMIKYVS